MKAPPRLTSKTLICGTPVPLNYIREEGKSGRMGVQMMAIAAEGKRQRYYLAPDQVQEQAAAVPRPTDVPEAELPDNARWFSPPLYGMRTYGELFTNRQLTTLTTLVGLIGEARELVISHSSDPSYADAICTYLAFAVNRVADRNSSICSWDSSPKMESLRNTFALQAIPMSWDFGEGNIFGNGSGNFSDACEWVAEVVHSLPASPQGFASQADAATASTNGRLVATDPPYYDNIGYSDLSDYFYVWLRRSLGNIYPDLLGTMLTPKADELVANPVRHNGKKEAQRFFEEGFSDVFRRICESTPAGFPITVFYAFKQAESNGDGDHASTGWETLLEGLLSSGWAVTATWPIRTELVNRPNALGANSLASSVVLACRTRPTDAGFTDRRGLINALREELPDAMRKLEQGKVAPVDLRQAAIGPGMAVFSRYARVNEPDGSPMRVRAALSLINQILGEILSQSVGKASSDTRFCVEWFRQYGFDHGPFGIADVLARGVDTAVEGLDRAGILVSRAGKVKLQSVLDIPDFYDPRVDDRTSEWEICLHLAKQFDKFGMGSAASVMAAARLVPSIDLDDVQDLAYLLYSIAENKKWAETALLFNNLGTSWTDIETQSRKIPPGGGGPNGELGLDYGSDDDGDE